jgi:hypothetical protein
MSRMPGRTGQAAASAAPQGAVHAALKPNVCPRCRKYSQHGWAVQHYESVNCRVRCWRNEKEAQGLRHAKMSDRALLDALKIPYEISPCEPKQGQCLYIDAEVHKVLSKTKFRIPSLAGSVWIKRPAWLIERWLREYADRRQ